MPTLEEIRDKIEASRTSLDDKIEWQSELKVILNDLVDAIESGEISFSNGLSEGKLGGELSESQTTISFPDASERMIQIGSITEGNNGGVQFELANLFENSDFHFSILAMLLSPTYQQGLFQVNPGGVIGQAAADNGTADLSMIWDSITLMVSDFLTGGNSQVIINGSMISFTTIEALFDAYIKAKAYQYTAYDDTIVALAAIPEEQRSEGMTFYAEDDTAGGPFEWTFEGGVTDGDLVEKNSRYFRGKKYTGPVYADDTAAGVAGLVAGEVYQRTTGELAVKL